MQPLPLQWPAPLRVLSLMRTDLWQLSLHICPQVLCQGLRFCHFLPLCKGTRCQELTTLWVARLDDGAELKVTDPKEQQGDVEEEEAKGKERRDGVSCGRRGTSC